MECELQKYAIDQLRRNPRRNNVDGVDFEKYS